jgi:hypothetical protein
MTEAIFRREAAESKRSPAFSPKPRKNLTSTPGRTEAPRLSCSQMDVSRNYRWGQATTYLRVSLILSLVWNYIPLGAQALSNRGDDQRIEKLTNLETSYPFWSPYGESLVFQ